VLPWEGAPCPAALMGCQLTTANMHLLAACCLHTVVPSACGTGGSCAFLASIVPLNACIAFRM
jgi:hypothetical protein